MKLQELREKKLLSIGGLGEKAMVPVGTKTAIEEGRVKPSQVTGNKLAKALEVRPNQFEEVLAAYQQAWEGRVGYLGPR